jgi:hypothetical protein
MSLFFLRLAWLPGQNGLTGSLNLLTRGKGGAAWVVGFRQVEHCAMMFNRLLCPDIRCLQFKSRGRLPRMIIRSFASWLLCQGHHFGLNYSTPLDKYSPYGSLISLIALSASLQTQRQSSVKCRLAFLPYCFFRQHLFACARMKQNQTSGLKMRKVHPHDQDNITTRTKFFWMRR